VSAVKRDSTATALDTSGEGEEAPPDSTTTAPSWESVSRLIHLQKGIDLELRIPKGYDISVACEGLDRLRFLAKSPDGRLFATDMQNVSDNKEGKVYIFDGWDSTAHLFKKIHTYLDRLHNPNQVAFYREKDKDYIYVSQTGTLNRYLYHAGDTIPDGPSQTIATWPDFGLSYKYGGWHLTRSIAFHRDRLYVSVGSSCNACLETEPVRASIQEMNPDGSDKKLYASGLRNSVGIKWIGDKLWVTSMGRDLLGRDRPEDLFQTVEKGVFYGWPYYYQYQGFVLPDTAMHRMAQLKGIKIPPPPAPGYSGFQAHSAPLGFDYLDNFSDPLLNRCFLVALHGSTTVSRQRGNSIVKIIGPNQYAPIVDGFLSGKTNKDRKGRPCDILQHDARSFFFTDDYNGVLYYVWKK
jgi:glucose/arabinose dehydrogenase